MSADEAPCPPDDAASDARRDVAIDRTVLAQLGQLDPDGTQQIVTRLLRIYSLSLAASIEELALAKAAGDWTVVRRIAHTLKSSSAAVGALEMARQCRQLEADLSGGCAGPAVLPSLEALRRESVHIQAELAAILQTRGDPP